MIEVRAIDRSQEHAGVADLSAEQVTALLAAATPAAPANLAGKDLSDLDLSRLDFRGADLRGTSFFGSRLVESDLRGANLEAANLNGAWLMGTDFSGARLAGASLLSVVILGGTVKKMPVFRNADLSGVKMIADLPGADLAGANFSRSRSGHSANSLRMCGTTIRRAILPVGAAYRTLALGLLSAHSSASRQHNRLLPQRREQHSTNTRPAAA